MSRQRAEQIADRMIAALRPVIVSEVQAALRRELAADRAARGRSPHSRQPSGRLRKRLIPSSLDQAAAARVIAERELRRVRP